MQRSKQGITRLLPVVLCLMTLLLAACGGNASPSSNTLALRKAPVEQQVFVSPESGVSDIGTFDPGLSIDLPSISAINMVFTGLVQLNDQLQVKPQLASSWEESASGLTWTFHLKPNLKFSDGTPLTSQDVAYSIDRALQPALKSTTAPIYLSLIKDSDKLVAGKIKSIIGDSVLTPDANTVVLIANRKASYFLNALTYPCSFVVEKSLVDRYGTAFTDHLSEGGGAGPFKVQEYSHSRQIVFVPNANYYGPKPQLQKVIFPFYKQSDTVYQAYQVNQVDITGIPGPHFSADKGRPDFHQAPTLQIDYYAMNYLAKPFDSINMRKAFALAIDKDEIAHAIWKGRHFATNHIIPQGMPGYNPNLRGPDGTSSTRGNPALARTLFQAGLKDEGLQSASQLPSIVLSYMSGSKDLDNEVAALIQMWQTVLGVSVKPQPIDFNKLLDEITAATNNPNGLQFWGIAWVADYPDPQDWTTLQFDAGVPNNTMNYGQNDSLGAAEQQAIQQLLESADANQDQNARLQAYENAEQALVNDVAWLPLTQVTRAYLLKPYVVGYTANPINMIPPDDWSGIYIAAH